MDVTSTAGVVAAATTVVEEFALYFGIAVAVPLGLGLIRFFKKLIVRR